MKPTSRLFAALGCALLLGGCGKTTLASVTPPTATPPAKTDVAAAYPGQEASLTGLPGVTAPSAAEQAAAFEHSRGYVPQGTRLSGQALPERAQTNKVALRVLVLSSGVGDFGVDSARSMLRESGVPFEVLDVSSVPLTMDTLIDADGVGRYQGVLLTSSALLMQPDAQGRLPSALDSSEWATLFEYERAYDVRQLALYGWPGALPEDYGLRAVDGAATSLTTAQATPAGQAALLDLTTRPIQLYYAPTYPAQVVSVPGVATTTPLLVDPAGQVLAATSTTTDGRERLLLTSMQAPTLLHTQLLGYGLVEWLTRGVHLGEHRRFLQVDIDDWFLPGLHYDAATRGFHSDLFRLSTQDALSVRDQQQAIQTDFPVARNFRYAMAFNGMNAQPDAPLTCQPDPLATSLAALSGVSRCLANDFDWVSHTKSHLRMDVMDEATALSQLSDNLDIGSALGLNVSRSSLVTGEQSGLGYMDPYDDGTRNAGVPLGAKYDLGLQYSNVSLLSAMNKTNTRYIAANHSIYSQWNHDCSTCGVVHPLNPDVFLVPRWPNGVAYFVTAPDEMAAYYNSVYGPQGVAPYWNHDLSYAEILEQESGFALNHLLDGGAFPHYMHAPNLHEYAPGKSVASDWIRALVSRYSSFSTLPLTTLRWDDLGRYLERRTRALAAEEAGQISGIYDRSSGSVTLSSTATVPYLLTGGAAGEPYGALRLQSGDVSGSLTVNVAPH